MTLSSSTAGLEPVSLWLLGQPFKLRLKHPPRTPRTPRARASAIGIAIRELRERRRMSRRRFAKLIGCGYPTLCQWEQGTYEPQRRWIAVLVRRGLVLPAWKQPSVMRAEAAS